MYSFLSARASNSDAKGRFGLGTRGFDEFEVFFRREYRQVVGLAFVLCGDRQRAEDLAQEAFAAAHRDWKRIGGYERPGAWVRRVVANRAVSLRRRRAAEARALFRFGGQRAASEQVLPDDDERVWEAVRALPRRQAQVVALCYLEDLSTAEIAAVLGFTEGTVKTHLRRARASLARRLKTSEPEEDH